VYFRRIKVGQVAAYDLDPDGHGITLRIFVNAPYDKFVGANTRFWHASGVDMQVDAGGIKLRAQSLVTILLGGVAFQAPNDDTGPPAKDDTAFALAANEATALRETDGPALPMMMYFNQSLRGLAPGAPVDFRGVVVGEVKSIGIEFDPAGREFRMPVLVQTYPNRLSRLNRRSAKAPDGATPIDPAHVLQILVSKGLRAQLRSGNLLSGQLYVALDFFPGAAPAKIDASKTPLEMATVPNGLDEIQSEVQDIARKLNKVPFDQIGDDLRKTLATLDRTLAGAEQLVKQFHDDVTPEIAAAMKDARRTLDSADRTLTEDSPLQQDVRQTLQELTRAAGSVRVLTDYLERHPESLLRGKPDDKG
jgi:paraquat-inducible protein B